MPPQLFGVSGRRVRIATSTGRILTTWRTELGIEFWDGTRFDSAPTVAVWDTAADFFTVSEWLAGRWGLNWRAGTEQLGSSGIGGSIGGVLVPLVFRLRRLRHMPFRVECQVLLGATFPQPLLGNLFVRRNFNVETRGERRTHFRLRDPAPDAVPLGGLRNP